MSTILSALGLSSKSLGWIDLMATEPPDTSNGAGANFSFTFFTPNSMDSGQYTYVSGGAGASLLTGLDKVFFVGYPFHSTLYYYMHSEQVFNFTAPVACILPGGPTITYSVEQRQSFPIPTWVTADFTNG